MNQNTGVQKCFFAGYSGKTSELGRLLSCGVPLTGVFTGGIVGKISNSQRRYLPGLNLLAQHVEMCHAAGVRLEILIDTTCFGAQHLWVRGQPLFVEYIRQLEESGVDGVILSDPVLIELTKAHSDLCVIVSRHSRVDSVQRACVFKRLGADAIILDPVLNRQAARLERVIESLGHVQPRLLLNEGCVPRCAYRPFHCNLLAHPDVPIRHDYYLANCTADRLQDPALILMSPTIRPEDLDAYQALLNQFCLSPRSARRSVAQNQVLAAYSRGRYEGDFLDLLSNRGYPLIRNIHINNRMLDGVWVARWRDCMSLAGCDDCDFCRDLAASVVNHVPAEQEHRKTQEWRQENEQSPGDSKAEL